MKCLFFTSIIILSTLLCLGQEKHGSLERALAKNVLRHTNEVGIGGDAGTPSEVLAFNLIFRSPTAAKDFKDVYQFSNIPGKFYCLMGLFLLKDTEYEKYKNAFLTLKSEDGIVFRAGCLRSNYNANDLLDMWMKGFATKVWYTEALIIK